jgi:hypothetical protein
MPPALFGKVANIAGTTPAGMVPAGIDADLRKAGARVGRATGLHHHSAKQRRSIRAPAADPSGRCAEHRMGTLCRAAQRRTRGRFPGRPTEGVLN